MLASQFPARLTAVLGLLAVALGAMGAHLLKDMLDAVPKGADHWKTASLYQIFHVLIMWTLVVRQGRPHPAWWCFLLGLALFSGSLYALALSGAKWLGAITPFGGIAFMIGWLWLAIKPPGPRFSR